MKNHGSGYFLVYGMDLIELIVRGRGWAILCQQEWLWILALPHCLAANQKGLIGPIANDGLIQDRP